MRYWCVALAAGGYLFAGAAAVTGHWCVFVLSAMSGSSALLLLFLMANKGES